jgi:hypothetical protein
VRVPIQGDAPHASRAAHGTTSKTDNPLPVRAKSLLIFDEAHSPPRHPAPAMRLTASSPRRRAILTRTSNIGCFLPANNGHSNSFTALLELLDPQQLIRGTDALTL